MSSHITSPYRLPRQLLQQQQQQLQQQRQQRRRRRRRRMTSVRSCSRARCAWRSTTCRSAAIPVSTCSATRAYDRSTAVPAARTSSARCVAKSSRDVQLTKVSALFPRHCCTVCDFSTVRFNSVSNTLHCLDCCRLMDGYEDLVSR